MAAEICTVIIGSNGAGKSAEVNDLALGIRNELSVIPSDRHPQARSFGLVQQSVDRLSISQRVSSFLETPLVLGGTSVTTAKKEVKTILNDFGSAGLYDRDIRTLSGGEDQLIHLLGGVVRGREGLIVDDPFGMLDARRTCEIQRVLQDYSKGVDSEREYRELVIAVPDSNQDLAAQFTEGSHDSLRIKLPKDETRENTLKMFMSRVPQIAVSPYSPIRFVFDSLRLALRDGRVLVPDLTVELMPGRIHLLTGENGAGKSLLLRAMTGQLPKAARIIEGTVGPGAANSSSRTLRRYAKSSIVFVPQHCHRLLTTTEPWSVIESLSASAGALLTACRPLLDAGVLWGQRPVTEAGVGEVQFITHLLAAISAITRPRIAWVLVDEPDAYLDNFYQQILARMYAAIASTGRGVLVTSHRKNIYLDSGATELRISSN